MTLFRNPKTAVKLIVAFLIICVAAWATTCSAQEKRTYTSFGAGATVIRGQTEAIELAHTWPVNNMKDAQWRLGLTLIGASDDADYQRNAPNNFCFSGQYIDGFGPVKVGIGLAACQNRDVYISSNTGFKLSLEYHFTNWYIKLGHVSNAGTVPPNTGRDFLLAMWKFN